MQKTAEGADVAHSSTTSPPPTHALNPRLAASAICRECLNRSVLHENRCAQRSRTGLRIRDCPWPLHAAARPDSSTPHVHLPSQPRVFLSALPTAGGPASSAAAPAEPAESPASGVATRAAAEAAASPTTATHAAKHRPDPPSASAASSATSAPPCCAKDGGNNPNQK